MPLRMATGHGAEPQLGERRDLKQVLDDQMRAASRQPLAIREPRPTKLLPAYTSLSGVIGRSRIRLPVA
jgi:hypothetical protein